jgi:nanoRNase/pAp phosphatase (c-di-AMP/oligoRNAs hydrolase)
MVAMAILLTKFDKFPVIYLDGYVPDNLKYLINICKYNSIKVLNHRNSLKNNIDAVIICDTPKRSMVDASRAIEKILKREDVIKIEVDHHIGADGEYIGDAAYSLVTEASSASELVGYLILKLRNHKDVLRKYLISDPFSRNLVLAILTGILGDTQKGQFLKSRREKKYYEIFSNMYNSILMTMTVRDSNFTNMEEVFKELQHLSEKEEKCYNFINDKQRFSKSIGYIVLHREDMDYIYRDFDEETIISVTKAVANQLAEKSGKLSLINYYDRPGTTGLIQFRMRRSHLFRSFDLRKVLEIFSIENGGGHEGAIGFRVPQKRIKDIDSYMTEIIDRLEERPDIHR